MLATTSSELEDQDTDAPVSSFDVEGQTSPSLSTREAKYAKWRIPLLVLGVVLGTGLAVFCTPSYWQSAVSSAEIFKRSVWRPSRFANRADPRQCVNGTMQEHLRTTVNSYPVVVFVKPFGPLSQRACDILTEQGMSFKQVPIDHYRRALVSCTGRFSAPSVWIRGRYVGDTPEPWLGRFPKTGSIDDMMKEEKSWQKRKAPGYGTKFLPLDWPTIPPVEWPTIPPFPPIENPFEPHVDKAVRDAAKSYDEVQGAMIKQLLGLFRLAYDDNTIKQSLDLLKSITRPEDHFMVNQAFTNAIREARGQQEMLAQQWVNEAVADATRGRIKRVPPRFSRALLRWAMAHPDKFVARFGPTSLLPPPSKSSLKKPQPTSVPVNRPAKPLAEKKPSGIDSAAKKPSGIGSAALQFA